MAQKNYCAKYRHLKRALTNINTVSSGNDENKRVQLDNALNYDDSPPTSSTVEQEATDKEINKSISAFLAGANDRQGGTKERQKNN